jgi:hypothetical protein
LAHLLIEFNFEINNIGISSSVSSSIHFTKNETSY